MAFEVEGLGGDAENLIVRVDRGVGATFGVESDLGVCVAEENNIKT